MASIAIPSETRPGPIRAHLLSRLRRPWIGAGAALAVFLAAVVAVARLLQPAAGGAPLSLDLEPAWRAAPEAWRAALPRGARPGEDEGGLFRLSDRPILPAVAPAEPAYPAGVSTGPLPPAPIEGLYAQGPAGPLPVIGPDGRTPFQAYRRPFAGDGRPKVALVVGGLGLNAHVTAEAIEALPPEVTLAFSPYADGLQAWIDSARAHGHEVLIEAPMEPTDYPDNDPGAYALMAEAPPAEVAKRLDFILARASGYFGVTNYLGSRFLAADPAYAAFAREASGRGLAFIDDGSAPARGGGLPRASAQRVVDSQLSPAGLQRALEALEASAVQRGGALGAGFAYPLTLKAVAQWAKGLDARGLQLAPASALAATR